MPVTVLADWKNALAPAMSRVSLSLTSTSAPDVVDGAVEIAPTDLDFDVGFVDVPTAPNLAAPAPTPQILGQRRRQLCLPVAHRFVTEHDAADEEHLSQVTQAQPVTQAP